MELNQLTAHELIIKLNNKEATTKEILASLDNCIKERDSKVNAYIRVNKNINPADATGIPVSIKDNICTDGYNTECCSKILCLLYTSDAADE